MNNKSISSKILRIFAFSWIFLLGLFVATLLVKIDIPIIIPIFLAIITFGFAIVFGVGGFYYVEMSVEANRYLQVRYFNLSPIGRNFKGFNIDLEKFHNFEIRKKGYFYFINLFEKSERGVAKYPTIGMSAMTVKERNAYAEFLTTLKK